MPHNKTILAHQLPGLSRTQTRDTRPVVASDSHVESFLFKSSVAVQMLVIGFWVGSWAVLLKVPIPLSQTRRSFFPYRVRETWKYEYLSHPLVAGQIVSMVLTRDSIGADGSHNPFFDQSTCRNQEAVALEVAWKPDACCTVHDVSRQEMICDSEK